MKCNECGYWGDRGDRKVRRALRLCRKRDVYTVGGDVCPVKWNIPGVVPKDGIMKGIIGQ